MEPRELRFFALGSALSRGAFAYAELAKAADGVAQMRSRIAQVGQLAKLAPVAERNRKMAGEHIAQALALMRALDAPPAALAPVEKAAARLAGPVPVSSDARPLLLVNRDAARVLSSLAEFGRFRPCRQTRPCLAGWARPGGRESSSPACGPPPTTRFPPCCRLPRISRQTSAPCATGSRGGDQTRRCRTRRCPSWTGR